MRNFSCGFTVDKISANTEGRAVPPSLLSLLLKVEGDSGRCVWNRGKPLFQTQRPLSPSTSFLRLPSFQTQRPTSLRNG